MQNGQICLMLLENNIKSGGLLDITNKQKCIWLKLELELFFQNIHNRLFSDSNTCKYIIKRLHIYVGSLHHVNIPSQVMVEKRFWK